MTRAKHIIGAIALPLLIVAGLVVVVLLNNTAREVVRDTAVLLFSIFATPFIFEITCAFLMLVALFLFNQWCLSKEGDGWVYLMTQEPETKNLPQAITQRLQSVVLPEKPEPVNDTQTTNTVIEGYLELGMPAQGLEELNAGMDSPEDVETSALRIRLLAANMDADEALTLLRDTAMRHQDSRPLMAKACLESARWLLKHLHREDLARRWLAEARALDSGQLNALGADDPLRMLV